MRTGYKRTFAFHLTDSPHIVGFDKVKTVSGYPMHGLQMSSRLEKNLCRQDNFFSRAGEIGSYRQPVIFTQFMPARANRFSQIDDIYRHIGYFPIKRDKFVFRQ